MARRKAITNDIAHIFRVHLVGRMKKWEYRKEREWKSERIENFLASLICLVGRVEK